MQISFIRSLGGVVFVLILVRHLHLSELRSPNIGIHLIRGALSIVGLWCYTYSFAHLPLALATALTFTKSLFLLLLARLILGEIVSRRNWLLVSISVMGTVLVLRPSLDQFNPVIAIALLSAFLSGAIMVCSKLMSRREGPLIIMVYVQAITFSAWLIPGLIYWQAVSFELGMPIVIVAMFGPLGQYLGIVAFSKVEAKQLADLPSMALILNIAIGYWLFGESLHALAFVGSSIIIICGLASARQPKAAGTAPTN